MSVVNFNNEGRVSNDPAFFMYISGGNPQIQGHQKTNDY